MTFSAIVLTPTNADITETYQVGTHADGRLVVHCAPGAPFPIGAEAVYDGSAPWSWGQFAREYPSLFARCTPHEYAGESTAYDIPAG